MSDKRQKADLEEFFNPEALRSKLIYAALYISAFELLKSVIIERLRGFLTIYGTTDDRKYQTEVAARDKSLLYASLKWLKESNVIDDGDMRTFERVKDRRNELAHAMAAMLWNGFPADIADAFKEMVALLDKIERWWIVNVEIATNPDFDGQVVEPTEVGSGSVMMLRMMAEIALGSEAQSKKYIEEYMKLTRPTGPVQ